MRKLNPFLMKELNHITTWKKKTRELRRCKTNCRNINCRKNGGIKASFLTAFNKFTADFNIVKEDVDNVKNKTIPDVISNFKNDIELSSSKVAQEVQERIRRSKNVLIHGWEDKDDANNDFVKVKDIISKMQLSVNLLSDNIKRLGSFDATKNGNNPRPLLVNLNDPDIVDKFLMNKDDDLKVGRDRTVLQRKQLSAAIKELEERKKKGEKNLKIDFSQGIPTVIENKKRQKIIKKPKDVSSKKPKN